MTEATFSKDSFGKNVILSGEHAVLRQVYNLLVMNKGTDFLNPDKGCEIMNNVYYRAIVDTNLSDLQMKIKEQIATYTPYEVNDVKCTVMKKEDKYYLCIVLSILPFIDPYVVISNGKQAVINKLNPSQKLNKALNT